MKKILLFLFLLTIVLATVAWIRHGGGEPYPDLSTTPTLHSDALEEVVAYSEPIGGVAVSADGRLFFSVHPDARAPGNRLLEFVNGASVPYPNVESQLQLFDTVSDITIDRQNRLWTIDHGNHGFHGARVVAIDLGTGKVLRDQKFLKDIAPRGSYLHDIKISADGSTAIIADASLWRKNPALIVYDVQTGSARRILERHASVSAERYLVRSGGRAMSFLGGIFSLRAGVSGVAIGPEWLYFGALSGSGLFRVRLDDLRAEDLPAEQLAARVERHATKPLSSGLSIDLVDNVYVTDVEHNSISVFDASGESKTLMHSDSIRWPDSLSFGPDGWLYVADSALPELVLRPREHITAQKPFKIFRFRPGDPGTPGQ